MTISLVADIGGTNTRLALARNGTLDLASVMRLSNAQFTGIAAVITAYLAHHPAQIDRACLAAAGPVRDGAAQMTNLGWKICAQDLTQATAARAAYVLNDLQAQGYALAGLSAQDRVTIHDGTPSGQTRLAIGLGTGLNAAVVHQGPAGVFVPPAEAGHITAPLTNARDVAMATRIAAGLDHDLACEDLLSGRGLVHIARDIAQQSGTPSPASSQEVLTGAQAGDATALAAVDRFVTLFARHSGDLALIHLPMAGIYLTGGMARALLPWMHTHAFADQFADKGRYSALVHPIPIHVVTDDFAALNGCLAYLDAHH